MPKQEKVQLVEQLTEKIKNNKGVVLTEYQGMTVSEITELRAKLRPLKCEYKVVKNTLSRIALKNAGLESFTNNFNGPTAIAISSGDPVASSKVLVDFSKEHAKLKIMAGLLGDKVLSPGDVKSLASLPSREVLIAKMLGTMNAPIAGFVNVLHGTTSKIVYALEAIRKQKEQQA